MRVRGLIIFFWFGCSVWEIEENGDVAWKLFIATGRVGVTSDCIGYIVLKGFLLEEGGFMWGVVWVLGFSVFVKDVFLVLG